MEIINLEKGWEIQSFLEKKKPLGGFPADIIISEELGIVDISTREGCVLFRVSSQGTSVEIKNFKSGEGVTVFNPKIIATDENGIRVSGDNQAAIFTKNQQIVVFDISSDRRSPAGFDKKSLHDIFPIPVDISLS